MKLATVLAALLTACCSSTPSNTATAARYGAELDACVVQAKTKTESQACRCEVSTKYRRPCDAP